MWPRSRNLTPNAGPLPEIPGSSLPASSPPDKSAITPTEIATATTTIAVRSNSRVKRAVAILCPGPGHTPRTRASLRGAHRVKFGHLGAGFQRLAGGRYELFDRRPQLLGQRVEIGQSVVIGVEPEVELPVVAHDGDAQSLILGQWHHRIHPLELPREHVQGELRPGDIGHDH